MRKGLADMEHDSFTGVISRDPFPIAILNRTTHHIIRGDENHASRQRLEVQLGRKLKSER